MSSSRSSSSSPSPPTPPSSSPSSSSLYLIPTTTLKYDHTHFTNKGTCPESSAWDKNADLQTKLFVLDGRNRVSRGRMDREERKGRQTRENGEGQGLHTRWHRGTGMVSQSHSGKQEGPGPTSPEKSRWKSRGVSRPLAAGSAPPPACLHSLMGAVAPLAGKARWPVMGPHAKLHTGGGMRINRQPDQPQVPFSHLASSLPRPRAHSRAGGGLSRNKHSQGETSDHLHFPNLRSSELSLTIRAFAREQVCAAREPTAGAPPLR